MYAFKRYLHFKTTLALIPFKTSKWMLCKFLRWYLKYLILFLNNTWQNISPVKIVLLSHTKTGCAIGCIEKTQKLFLATHTTVFKTTLLFHFQYPYVHSSTYSVLYTNRYSIFFAKTSNDFQTLSRIIFDLLRHS